MKSAHYSALRYPSRMSRRASRHRVLSRVRPGRNPFELWIVGACVFTGIVGLLPLHATQESVVDRFLPQLATLWYVGIGLAGTLTLIGTLLPIHTVKRASLALHLEQTGLIVLAGLLAGYGFAIEFVAPRTPTGILLIALSCAAITRRRQICREFTALSCDVMEMTRASNDDHEESSTD